MASSHFVCPGGGSDRLWILPTTRHASAPALPPLSCLSDDRYVYTTLPLAGLFPGAQSCTFRGSSLLSYVVSSLNIVHLVQTWRWAGHIARMKDNRWTKRCTEWQPRRGKRSRGRPSRRWQDDITEKEGTTWIRKATDRRQWKTLMEGYILQWMDKA